MKTLWAMSLLILQVLDRLETAPPPMHPPEFILVQLTQNGTIPIEHYYVDDSNKGKGTHYKFSFNDITDMISQTKSLIGRILSMPHPPAPPTSVPSSSSWLTQLTDAWLVHAINKYSVRNKKMAVFGSTSPFYEALALSMGAEHVTVMEYNRLTYSHPNITTVLVTEVDIKTLYRAHFDVALSLSSFDHDGLGRYGDPIDPDADLHAMEVVREVLKPDGLLFLTVPLGPDVVVWNLHRRYGKIRLPRLLRGWEEVECVGWREELVEQPAPYTLAYEPVFVLRTQKDH